MNAQNLNETKPTNLTKCIDNAIAILDVLSTQFDSEGHMASNNANAICLLIAITNLISAKNALNAMSTPQSQPPTQT